MTPKDGQLIEKLKVDQQIFEEHGDSITMVVEETLDAIDLSKRYQVDLESYEVLKGTMDDVFLNLTGRELR